MGETWSFDFLLLDHGSMRNSALVLARTALKEANLDRLHVALLAGDEEVPDEVRKLPRLAVLPRQLAEPELRKALLDLLAGGAVEPGAMPTIESMVPVPTAAGTLAEVPSPPAPRPMPPPQPGPEQIQLLAPIDPTGAPKRGIGGHVLLVEDNPVNQMVAQRLLGMLGLQCETADNGEKALDRMRMGGLDLILMDCQMPVKDGYTATTECRQHEFSNAMPRIPIIAMTANAMAGDRQKCIDAGMDDYLSKPVDRRVLEATIGRWLRAAQGIAQPAPAPAPPPVASAPLPTPLITVPTPPPALAPVARPALPLVPPPMPRHVPETIVAPPPPRPVPSTNLPPPPPRPQPPPVAASYPTHPVQHNFPPAAAPPPTPAVTAPAASAAPVLPVLAMDVVEELRAVMGPEYLVLIKLFLEDAPSHIQKLEAAAASNNIEAMVAPAHTLKSSSANLGALALSAVAKRIEIGARSEALPRPTVAVVMLENEFRRAQLALTALMQP
jgi:CheY-like chemotaxis protein/HPt (histidine-containing phosphotransfer) domain-containing protein